MSMNILNDISQVYMEKVSPKPDFLDLDKDGNKKEPMKKAAVEAPKERLKTDRDMFNIPKDEQKAARERLLAKARAKREKMKEELDPVGQEDSDIDNDGDTDSSDKYLHKRRKAIGKAIKKEKMKESFSNWRQDLSEVMDDIEANKQIKEKKVNNKIKINPEMKESFEEFGATLIEMVEIDEFDYIVESAYDELLEEGYEEDDIEEALEFALTEAKVTFGHDTATTTEKKKKSLLDTAREKLSGAKASAKAAVARGARKVAKGALGVARKMEGGDKAPKRTERKPSTYRGAGAGQKERVSSGSYTAPTKKKAEKPADPWEGSSTTPPKAKAKKAASPKVTTKTTKVTSKKKKSNLDNLLASIRNEEVELEEGMTMKDFKQQRSRQKQKEKRAADKIAPNRRKDIHTDRLSPERAARHRANVDPDFEGNDERNYPGGKLKAKKVRKAKALGELGEAVYGGTPEKKEEPKDTRMTVTAADKKGNTPAYQKYKAGNKGYKAAPHLGEEVLDEKAVSKSQQRFMGMVYAAKKGETPASPEVASAAKSISKGEAKKFAKTKHEGLPDKVKEELEVLDERRREDKGTPRPQRDRALEVVKGMIRQQTGKPAGQRKKVPGKKPPKAGEYGAPQSPEQKVKLRKAQQKRSQELQQDTKGT